MNLIEAPTGSGKTTFAVEKLPSLALNRTRVLFLIDTRIGVEQLLKHKNVQSLKHSIRVNDVKAEIHECVNKITVMTYACFGVLVKFNLDFADYFDVIICDEMHNIFWPINANKQEICRHFSILTEEEITKLIMPKSCGNFIALEEIKRCIANERQYVIGLTATPQKLFNELGSLVEKINTNSQLIQYETINTTHYSHLELLLNNIKQNEKGIIYVSHISEIKKYTEFLRNKGIKTEGIWSINNHKHSMSKSQKDIRNYIINNNMIPSDIDILFINKSCETSLNIFSKLDFMIIHSSDEDTQIQARGRFRGDLNNLYLLNRTSEIVLPEKMINRKLYKKDVDEFILKNNIRDKKGELIRQPTLKKMLVKNNYVIKESRDNKSNYFIVSYTYI